MEENIKKFRKDCGICLRYKENKQILKSKYKSEKEANTALTGYRLLGVINKDHEVYKCPICKMYHLGDLNFEAHE